MSLQYKLEQNKSVAYRLACRQSSGQDSLDIMEERPEEEVTAPTVTSVTKDVAPTEKKLTQGLETLHSAVPSFAVDGIDQNKTSISTTVIIRGSAVRSDWVNDFDYPLKPRQKATESHQPCTVCATPLDLSTLTDYVWEYLTVSLYWLR
jgi:hypothetical protein